MARVENGFGKLEEGQLQNRIASEQRSKELHKRIDKVEEKIEKIRAPTSRLNFETVLGALITYWKIPAALLMIVAGWMMGKSPAEIKAWLGL